MGSDPEPEPRSKGELRRKQILEAIAQYIEQQKTFPSVMDIGAMSGIRSFNTLTRHLNILKKEGLIEWDHASVRLKDEDGFGHVKDA